MASGRCLVKQVTIHGLSTVPPAPADRASPGPPELSFICRAFFAIESLFGYNTHAGISSGSEIAKQRLPGIAPDGQELLRGIGAGDLRRWRSNEKVSMGDCQCIFVTRPAWRLQQPGGFSGPGAILNICHPGSCRSSG